MTGTQHPKFPAPFRWTRYAVELAEDGQAVRRLPDTSGQPFDSSAETWPDPPADWPADDASALLAELARLTPGAAHRALAEWSKSPQLFVRLFGFLRSEQAESELAADYRRQGERVGKLLEALPPAGGEPLATDEQAALLQKFNGWLPEGHLDLRLVQGDGPSRFEPVPRTMLGFVWFQLGREIAGLSQWRQCKQCTAWFEVDSPASRREFHSNRCRKAFGVAQRSS